MRRAVEDTEAGRIAVIAKLNMADGVDDGITVEESLQTAKWLQDDGYLDAIERTAGSSLGKPDVHVPGRRAGQGYPGDCQGRPRIPLLRRIFAERCQAVPC